MFKLWPLVNDRNKVGAETGKEREKEPDHGWQERESQRDWSLVECLLIWRWGCDVQLMSLTGNSSSANSFCKNSPIFFVTELNSCSITETGCLHKNSIKTWGLVSSPKQTKNELVFSKRGCSFQYWENGFQKNRSDWRVCQKVDTCVSRTAQAWRTDSLWGGGDTRRTYSIVWLPSELNPRIRIFNFTTVHFKGKI